MLIGAYGMFWDKELVDWNPGSGPTGWKMLGRHGANRPKLRIVDFRSAHGVYILFNNFGAYYAGLAKGTGGLGSRLKQHTHDRHADKWERFCWFAFDGVSEKSGANGLHTVQKREKPVPADGGNVIRELEALLIQVLGTSGQNNMRFQNAVEWKQVGSHDADSWTDRVRQ